MRGVPWAIAFEELSDTDALGMAVAVGELSGGSWDWQHMRWRERAG